MRITLTIATAAIVGLTLAGCLRLPVAADTEPGGEAPSSQNEPEEAPEPVVEPGTRDNPFAIGATTTVSEGSSPIWDISVGPATYAANEIVRNENQFNDVPPPGFEYVLLPATVTYKGESSVTPYFEWSFAFVTASGETHDQAFAVIPSNFNDVGDLYAGGTGTGNIAFVLPSDKIAGGTWRATLGYGFDIFWAAQ